jgi:hypothetical protein
MLLLADVLGYARLAEPVRFRALAGLQSWKMSVAFLAVRVTSVRCSLVTLMPWASMSLRTSSALASAMPVWRPSLMPFS